MKSRKKFAEGRMFWETVVQSLVGLLSLTLVVPLTAQNCPNNPGVRTICKTIGNAESVSVTSPFAAYPALQPVVYWHDDNWKIDMLPQPASDGDLRMKITSRNDDTKIIKFPGVFFAQVDSITRNPEDLAIVIGEPNGTSSVFSIVDLKLGKIIDGSLLYDPSISPNRRFLLYTDWFPPHAESSENLYSLYDTLKTPDENTCGYGENNPEYKKNSDQLDYTQVYPYQAGCLEGQDDSDDNRNVSDFIWTPDSSKVVFADVKSGVMSLILVTMPNDDRDKDHQGEQNGIHSENHDQGHRVGNDRPRTLIYSFVGAENVCGAVGPLGKTGCDSNNVRSLAWNGDAVNVALVQANPTGPAIVKNLTIPLSKFMPIRK